MKCTIQRLIDMLEAMKKEIPESADRIVVKGNYWSAFEDLDKMEVITIKKNNRKGYDEIIQDKPIDPGPGIVQAVFFTCDPYKHKELKKPE